MRRKYNQLQRWKQEQAEQSKHEGEISAREVTIQEIMKYMTVQMEALKKDNKENSKTMEEIKNDSHKITKNMEENSKK